LSYERLDLIYPVMAENQLQEEIIPGVPACFSKTGLETDVLNASWVSNLMNSAIGNYGRLKPVPHYREYFEKQDRIYEAAGKPGLLSAVMQKSDPRAVAAFDKLTDEFNASLDRIITDEDNDAVQGFLRRVSELRDKLPDDSQEGSQG